MRARLLEDKVSLFLREYNNPSISDMTYQQDLLDFRRSNRKKNCASRNLAMIQCFKLPRRKQQKFKVSNRNEFLLTD
jgi:hypothetical protein